MNYSTRIFLSFLCVFLVLSQAPTSPIDAIGTVLPKFFDSSVTPYRAFNDLMKQSLQFNAYQLSSWGSIGRCWGSCSFPYIDNLIHKYPASLPNRIWAGAEIPFLDKNDDALLNQVFNIQFGGNGIIGVFQTGMNITWNSGTGGQFTLKYTNQSLFVYIYNTDISNPVRNITILPVSLGQNPPTFTTTFLNYLKPFNLLRTCFWQGQNLHSSGKQLQIWNNRTLLESSTQVTSSGVALEHILELEAVTGATIWPCIPDSADTNYITQMGSLLGANRNKSKLIYLEFGNVYHIMNDFPDAKTNPAFDTFIQAYGIAYRQQILFTINYKDVQYYINAMGMRKTPVNFTYIDAIGFEPNFGQLSIGQVWNATVADIKSNLTNIMLSTEVNINKAFQMAKRNGTNLITFSGGPYLKTYQYDYIWKNKTSAVYADNATMELNLANTLKDMNLNDPWVGEFYLQWIARLKSMGMKSITFCQFVGGPWTLNTDIVPLVQYLNMTTPVYTAIKQYVANGRKTTLQTFGTVPPNPFVCSKCVWGDCIQNQCVCYAGYSGATCQTYTAPAGQNKIGVGLQGVTYWSTQHPFIDMHKQGSGWVYFLVEGGWSSGDAFKSQVQFDSDGYPTYLPPGVAVGTLIARDIQTHYDPGNYTILYDGDGILSFGMFDLKRVVSYGIGKCVLEILPSTNFNNGIFIRIDRTNPDNYIRNLRVIRPGFQNTWWTQTFSPLMLEKLAPFGTLRFMDWTDTNDQTDQDWADRVQLSSRTYTINGAPWEEVIHLANLLGKDVWINIPYLATSDYITKLAQLFLNKLEPHLKVHVEYSNQVWGTLFLGGRYAQDQGVKYYQNNITDPTQARFCMYALITKNISTIWRSVWSSPENRARLRIVAATQAVNADTTKRILACQNLYQSIDQVAIAPYLSIGLKDTMTSANIFDGMNVQIGNIAKLLKTHLNITNKYNLSLTTYQSGQGLGGSTTITNKLANGIQTDDRMRSVYVKYHEMLFNNSITLANHYTDSGIFSRYGSFGMFQFTDQKMNASSKWNGTKEYLLGQNLTLYQSNFGSCNLTCNGNGICSFGKCVCYSDFTGPDCSIAKFIDFVQCGYLCSFNQGVCQLKNTIDNYRYFSCTCNPGYTGADCVLAICDGKCNYNGKCTAPNTCSCFRGKMGAQCQTDCGCGGHGTCNADATCKCDNGFVFNTTSKKCEFQCFGQVSSNCNAPNSLGCSSGCVGGTCQNGTCVCWPGFHGTDCSTQVPVQYLNGNLGINVGGLNYWSTQHLLKDYFKQSSQWIPQYYPGFFNSTITFTWNTSEYFPKQPNGYPASLAANQSVAKLLLRDLNLKYPSINTTNEYVLLYDGDGLITLGFDATATEYSAGRIKFTVKPQTVRDNGVIVKLLLTNPANPVKNIRVVLARDQYNFQKDLLSENFMTFISQFSTIRSMELLSTNVSPVQQWSQGTRPDQDTQANPTGISIQLLTKIIQRTGRNLWINVPHLASDDYVQKLAQYLKDNLSSNKIVYVEYSNEVWNTFFAQGKYATDQASKLGLANYHKFYAQRSLQIFNIFKSVYTTQSSKLQFVVSFQVVSKWVADQILSGTNLVGVANIVAGGVYYDCDSIGNYANTALYATLTPVDIINRCSSNSSFASMDPWLTTNNVVAKTYNLSMTAYEAGTSISEVQVIYNGGDNPSATVNFIAANRAPPMYEIFKTLLNKYKNANYTQNAPLMLFSSIGLPSKYGSWGLLDYLDQVAETPTHPKFQAVIDFNQGI